MRGEFDLIAELFGPLAAKFPGALGLLDDGAIIRPRPDRDLVITKDLMVAGIHFAKDDPADAVARKLLRVNLSDLAAMGAEAIGYTLGFAAPPDIDIEWIRLFCRGLDQDQTIFDLSLIGGDTVQTSGPLTLSLTAFGDVPTGQALKRSNAQPGDKVMVSGTIGDGYLGLEVGHGMWPGISVEHRMYLIERLRIPEPRISLGISLRGIARGVADISDGLVADLGHICAASRTGAIVHADQVPLSSAALAIEAIEGPGLTSGLLSGGDDYELLFTIDPDDHARVSDLGKKCGVAIAEIGQIVNTEGVQVVDAGGQTIKLERSGYSHF